MNINFIIIKKSKQSLFIFRDCLLYITIVFFSFSCAKEIEKKQSRIPFILQKVNDFTLNPPDSILFGKISSNAAISSSGEFLAFYDQIKKSVIVADTTGKIIRIFGSKGRGPKEFENIYAFNFDENDNIVVYDFELLRIKIFDINGNLLRIFAPEGEPSNHYIDASSLYAYNGFIYFGAIDANLIAFGDQKKPFWNSRLIAKYDYKGNLVERMASYDNNLSKRDYYLTTPIIAIDTKTDRLFSTHMHYYGVQEFDLKTDTLISKFGVQSESYRLVEEDKIDFPSLMDKQKRIDFSTQQSYAISLHASNKYVYVEYHNISEDWYKAFDKSYKEYFLTVYDRNTKKYLSEIKLPFMLTAMNNNRVFLIENDNPDNYQIGSYEIVNPEL